MQGRATIETSKVRQENAEIPNSPALQQCDEFLNCNLALIALQQVIESLRSSPWYGLEKNPNRSGNVRGQPCSRSRIRGVAPEWIGHYNEKTDPQKAVESNAQLPNTVAVPDKIKKQRLQRTPCVFSDAGGSRTAQPICNNETKHC
jgi:hypothetical protein